MIINGKEVKTNYGKVNYPLWNGNDYPTTMRVMEIPLGESEESVLEQLVDKGYTKVTFYERTTRVRGYHHVYAFYK